MAAYKDAVAWIAANDGGDDTTPNMSWEQAFSWVDGLVTVCLVADLFGKDPVDVACDVLRKRGFRKARNRPGQEIAPAQARGPSTPSRSSNDRL